MKQKTTQNQKRYPITLVGMGPGSERYLTEEAISILTSGEEIWLRTEKHPCVPWLKERGMKSLAFDFLYEDANTFEEVYERLADRVLETAKEKPVTLALPGNVHVAEKTTERIKKKLAACDRLHVLRCVHGTSFIDAMVTAIGFDPIHGLRIVDAFALIAEAKKQMPKALGQSALAQKTSSTKKRKPGRLSQLIVVQVYDRLIASEVKMALSERYGDTHPACVISSAGDPERERRTWTELWKLDHSGLAYDHLTSIYVPRVRKRSPRAEIFE